eukprot:TRINITY_DN10435_c0_g1_i1.p1 TRINITY_DN10435_c0_g1~~TRINITY_DN10435_c0_g1_i1.p1  ORF type:complete len:374 (-),score=55.92 TRINITY_DN10435_c0_g1_i1:913-2034(-)
MNSLNFSGDPFFPLNLPAIQVSLHSSPFLPTSAPTTPATAASQKLNDLVLSEPLSSGPRSPSTPDAASFLSSDHWTKEETLFLIDQLNLHGPNWNLISSLFDGFRTALECQHRAKYVEEYLSAVIKERPKSPSSPEPRSDSEKSPTNSNPGSRRPSPQPSQKRKRRTAAEISRSHKCIIPSCRKSYGSEGALRIHIKKKHPNYDVEAKVPPPSPNFQQIALKLQSRFEKKAELQNEPNPNLAPRINIPRSFYPPQPISNGTSPSSLATSPSGLGTSPLGLGRSPNQSSDRAASRLYLTAKRTSSTPSTPTTGTPASVHLVPTHVDPNARTQTDSTPTLAFFNRIAESQSLDLDPLAEMCRPESLDRDFEQQSM